MRAQIAARAFVRLGVVGVFGAAMFGRAPARGSWLRLPYGIAVAALVVGVTAWAVMFAWSVVGYLVAVSRVRRARRIMGEEGSGL